MLVSSKGGRGDEDLGHDHLREGLPGPYRGLGSVDPVVGADVLEDGLAGGSLHVGEGLDSILDHCGLGREGGFLVLTRSGSGGGHDE